MPTPKQNKKKLTLVKNMAIVTLQQFAGKHQQYIMPKTTKRLCAYLSLLAILSNFFLTGMPGIAVFAKEIRGNGTFYGEGENWCEGNISYTCTDGAANPTFCHDCDEAGGSCDYPLDLEDLTIAWPGELLPTIEPSAPLGGRTTYYETCPVGIDCTNPYGFSPTDEYLDPILYTGLATLTLTAAGALVVNFVPIAVTSLATTIGFIGYQALIAGPVGLYTAVQATLASLPAPVQTSLAVAGAASEWCAVYQGLTALAQDPNSPEAAMLVASQQTGLLYELVEQTKCLLNNLSNKIFLSTFLDPYLTPEKSGVLEQFPLRSGERTREELIDELTDEARKLADWFNNLPDEEAIEVFYRIRTKYNLPPEQMRLEDSWEYQRRLLAIAKEAGVDIKPASELQRFFEKNPNAAGVTFGTTCYINLDNPSEPYLAHEVTHGLQRVRTPRMPLVSREFEAYLMHVPGVSHLRTPSGANFSYGRDILTGMFFVPGVRASLEVQSTESLLSEIALMNCH